MPVATPVGDPFAPFVVGDEGGSYDEDDEKDDEDLHRC